MSKRPQRTPARSFTQFSSPGNSITPAATVIPTPPTAPLEFWYHRWNGASPTFVAETVAVAKGMIPIINIANSTYSWGDVYEAAALQFQSDNGGCKIALSQAFWSQTAETSVAWDVENEWPKYIAKRLADTATRIMMIDVEPPALDDAHDSVSILDQLLNAKPAGANTYGIAGSTAQIAAAEAFIAAQTKFLYALPDLRTNNSIVPTTIGSLYNLLPGLGTIRMNEGTYTPGASLVAVDPRDVVGIRVSTDGRSYSYTPEEAKAVFIWRNKMYFNIETTDEAKLNIINRM